MGIDYKGDGEYEQEKQALTDSPVVSFIFLVIVCAAFWYMAIKVGN